MSTKAPKQETEFELVPEGTYIARIYRFIHLGTQSSMWSGKETLQKKILLSFELPLKKTVFKKEDGEQPFTIHSRYTLSMFKTSQLRQMVESIMGKKMTDEEAYDFELEDLVGKACMISVVHNDGFANIKSIVPMPEGITCPEPINEPFILNFTDQWSDEKFESLSKNLQDTIEKSPEYDALKNPLIVDNQGEVDPNDIPF